MVQVLEFYPTEKWCIQWCLHCPRSISKPEDSLQVSWVNKLQQGVAERVLKIFRWEQPESQLNLAWYIWAYDFELFDNVAPFHLSGISFNLWTISQTSADLIEDNIVRLWEVLPQDTSGKGIFTYGNFQLFDASPKTLEWSILTRIIERYFKAIQTHAPHVVKKNIWAISIAANNIPERNFDFWTARLALKGISDFQRSIADAYYMWQKLDYYNKEGLFLISSKLVWADDYNFDVSMRWVKAKKAKKMSLAEAVKNCEKSDFYISLFPDKVMVYHSPWNIHLDGLFFSYEEFDDIIRERTKRRIWGRNRTLREIVNERLRERVHHTGHEIH